MGRTIGGGAGVADEVCDGGTKKIRDAEVGSESDQRRRETLKKKEMAGR
ncbi:hypothetical protein [Maritalea sp.]